MRGIPTQALTRWPVKVWRWLYLSPDWRPHITGRREIDVDGRLITGHMMRRRHAGTWEYRKMTADERLEWQDSTAY